MSLLRLRFGFSPYKFLTIEVRSLEQRVAQAAEADEAAAFEALNRERIEAEGFRIQAELERRNALEHTDSECCVCFDEVNEAERKALSCAHWLCAAHACGICGGS